MISRLRNLVPKGLTERVDRIPGTHLVSCLEIKGRGEGGIKSALDANEANLTQQPTASGRLFWSAVGGGYRLLYEGLNLGSPCRF